MNASYNQYESLRPSLGLIPAHDALENHPALDGAGIELAMDFEFLALECGADPSWDRAKLITHQRRTAGRKGGLATFARYGRPYYRALARVRWGETPTGALGAIREILAEQVEQPVEHFSGREIVDQTTDHERGGGELAA